jgi:small-conductance mechanosensitive channel
LLLASAGIIKPKDNISFFSWLFNNPVVGEVKDVKLLTVSVETIDGNITELPNTALLGSSQFTNLTVNGKIRTVQTVALPVDANIKNIMDFSRQKIESSMKDFGVTKFESYFYTKNFNSNVIKVIFEFNDILMFNPITDLINRSYEAAYWEMKNMAPQGNNILLGFPVDVPIDDLIKEGNNVLRTISEESGITEFSSYFFAKNSAVNTIKIVFSLKKGASYDSVAHSINSSYEKAYAALKAKQSAHNPT